jgi:hypothetical protein
MEQNRNLMRNIGLVLVLLTPITAFISFAIFAILFGEENIEGENANAVLSVLAHAGHRQRCHHHQAHPRPPNT